MRGSVARPGAALYYVDPMHPWYRSDKPGKAPDCGMDLEPVYGARNTVKAASAGDANVVAVTPEQERVAQLQTEIVQATPFAQELHTAGRVAPDEALTFAVSAGVDGWVRRVFSDQTGNRVKRGDVLATFYSKEISAPQQAFLYALESYERLRRTTSPAPEPLALTAQQLATAHDNLLFMGMGESQIEELARARREAYDIDLTAPAGGLILERRVAAGTRFMKGELLYRIASLEHVWVLADVNRGDVPPVAAVAGVQVHLQGLPPVEAHASRVPLQFDGQGRTGKLRLELMNPHRILVPGMIVGVIVRFRPRQALTVHADGVIDSGTTKSVFVARGGGEYELRAVVTGSQEGNRVEILAGLKAGERVVTEGAFLLDSETRLKSPAAEVLDTAHHD
jgi:RND family efflux transporter MFP subunit